jgi:hypothetical protein
MDFEKTWLLPVHQFPREVFLSLDVERKSAKFWEGTIPRLPPLKLLNDIYFARRYLFTGRKEKIFGEG